ncbi:MAG: ribonuclease HI [Desulfobulbaceae bacterium]|nr:ribonuclease HI [Desulfobulbaceae bacterium]
MASKKKYYAVAAGRKPGIYHSWPQTLEQVHHYSGAVYKSFSTLSDAEAWLDQTNDPSYKATSAPTKSKNRHPSPTTPLSNTNTNTAPDTIIIYTDGGALGNPGPGGYGAVLNYNEHCKELTGGFRLTTNNRMELLAAIMALRSITSADKPIILHSDSAYMVNGFQKGWVKGWKKRGWKKSDKQPVLNIDLWQELADLVDQLKITFKWVKGHAGDPLNERCDQLARESAGKPDLPPDVIYENQSKQSLQAS